MADSMLGTVAKSAIGGALKGAASSGSIISAPFKAIQTGGNAIKGIKKNLTNFADKQSVARSRVKNVNPKAIKSPLKVKTNPQLKSANRVANRFASKVQPSSIIAPKANVEGAINKYQNKQKKIAKILANPVSKPTYEDKIKKALGMKV